MVTHIRRFVVTPWRLLRQRGLLSLTVYTCRWLRSKYLTLQVRRLYFVGQKRHHAPNSGPDERQFAEEIVSYGLDAISQTKAKYADLYAGRTDLRILFNMPQGGAQHFYYYDLAQCLQHTGVMVRLYTTSAENLEQVLSDFRPSVFITSDRPNIAQTLDTDSLTRFKGKHGLARLYIPDYPSPLKPGRWLLTEEEVERVSLHHAGKLADAFVGYFEDVFWDCFCEPWKETGLSYYSIPFAANPLRHYPVLTAKDLDWGIATANSDLGGRARLTYKYMSHIMGKYTGAIAGYNWGKGISPVPPDQIAQFFCRVRISPNIAAESNVRYPLDCGAKVHELSAMGVFQLTTETDAMRWYYSLDEIVGFRGAKQFNALFDYFVDKPQVRQMFVRKGMARTLTENTYFQRIEKLIEVLDQHPKLYGN